MMYFQLVWRFLTLFVFWKTATSTDFGYVTPIWSPQTDVCKPGPAGRIPWILHVRDSDYGWREHTHRAMIAVVVSGEYVDEDDMKKMQLQLEVELTRALFRNKTHPIDDGDLALYIHALLATNRNPRNFHGTDLVADLLQRVDNAAGQVNPFLVLALCNSHAVTYRHLVKIKDIAKYNHIVQPNNLLDVHPDVDSRIVQKKALAFKAFACAATYQSQLHKFSQEMTSITECLHRKYDEETGSFGNVYTTSLAVQAFTAANDSPLWYDKRKSVAYLEGEAFKDVNLIKAYYIEMALNAHKYKFIRELYDGVPLPGVAVGQLDMQYVQYTIKKARWPDMYFSMTLKVQKGTNFYDVMKIAANTSAIFNFTTYQSNHGEPMVYAVSGVPNDVEENVFWRLCRETKVNHTSHTSLIHTFHEYVGLESPIWSPESDVCKPGPDGRVPWILHVRDSDYGWREHTHRAMIALAVSNYPIDDDEMKRMHLQLDVELTRALFRNRTHPIDDSDLALYIHALLATNKNPRNFHGTDLVADLLNRVENAAEVNPFLVLALCNSHVVAYRHLIKLIKVVGHDLNRTGSLLVHPDVDSRVVQKKALAFKAFACAATYYPQLHKFSGEMQTIVECLHRKYDEANGSFGNVYTTSLAVQAFTVAGNSPAWWDKRKSQAYLEDESVKEVNLIKAYYIEMALNAQKYKFIRELYNGELLPVTVAQPDTHYLQYTIKKSKHPDMYFTVTVNVEKGANFYEVMKIAANASDAFNFTTYRSNSGEPMVYAVAGVPNDVEENVFWRLCRQTVDHDVHRSLITTFDESPTKLIPGDGEHLVYIYSNADCPRA